MNYLKHTPVTLTVIVPLVFRIVGPAVTFTYLPETHNFCVAGGVGASAGRTVAAGAYPVRFGDPKSITEGSSLSGGYQKTILAGAQGTVNQSGVMLAPSFGTPGASGAITYGWCF